MANNNGGANLINWQLPKEEGNHGKIRLLLILGFGAAIGGIVGGLVWYRLRSSLSKLPNQSTLKSQDSKKDKEKNDNIDDDDDDIDIDDENNDNVEDVIYTPPTLQELIEETPIKEVIPHGRRLIICEANDSIDVGLMTLQENNITAIPVVDLEKREYLGMFSTHDLAAYLTSTSFPIEKSDQVLQDQRIDLPNGCLRDVVNFSKVSHFVPQELSAPLSSLMEIFAQGVHRTPLKNEKGQIVSIITQSDVLRFLIEHRQKLGGSIRQSRATLTLEGWGLSDGGLTTSQGLTDDITTISMDTSVVSILPLLSKLPALAIVDEKGTLVGELSRDSLRVISQYDFHRIYKPVSTLKNTEFVCAHKNDTLDDVIDSVVKHKAHVVWVVDDFGKPTKLITITEIIQKLLEKGII